MKKVLLTAVALTVGMAASAADTLKVDLKKALEVALSDNPTIKVADKEIERVDYSKKEAWYGVMPSLSGTGQYSRSLKKQTMVMSGQAFEVGQDNTVAAGLSLSLPLIVPALWHSIQSTELDMQLALEMARASKITLRNDVKKAFYSAMLAQDSYATLKEGYDVAKQNYENAKRLYEVGAAAEYDLVSSEVQMRNLMPNLLQVENGVKQSKLYLKVLMGLDANVELVVDGKLVDFENELQAFTDTNTFSLENNSDITQLSIQQKQLDIALKATRSQRIPSLVAFGSFQYQAMGDDKGKLPTSNPMSSGIVDMLLPLYQATGVMPPAASGPVASEGVDWGISPSLAIGVQLNVPLSGIFTNTPKEKKLKIQSLQLDMQRDYLESSLNVQAVAALDNMKKAVEQVESNKDNVRLAQKGYDISQKRYETGMGTMLELQGAALALTQSKLSYSQSISDYLSAKSEFEKIVGI